MQIINHTVSLSNTKRAVMTVSRKFIRMKLLMPHGEQQSDGPDR